MHTAFAPPGADAVLDDLLARMLAEARARAVALIRSRLVPDEDTRLADRTGWPIGYVLVAKDPVKDPAKDLVDAEDVAPDRHGAPPISVRPARAADGAFVAALMRRGLEEGLTPGERARVGAPELERAVDGYFARLRAKGAAYAAVAEAGGERLGASLVDLDDACETLGRRQAYVHDVYVLPGALGRGVARRLYADLEAVAHAAGIARLAATVSAPTADALRARLDAVARAGWAPAYVSRVLDVPA